MAYGAATTEQQPYSTVRHCPEFDLRRYPEHVLAEVDVRESFERAGNAAFNALFRYISGNNQGRREIPMTAPVWQRLGRAAREAGPVPVAAARLAPFDPPFTPAFLRRNEVVLLVSGPGAGAEPAPR
ncbi:UNVERIFIED_CONTAM: heme-binding protein [Kocuria sp. CPCC 205316]|uniref:SOUL family heme-binding protein n=1 Tax=Kocuria TaxID=57493 RepID=UPI0036DE90E8